jgi:hypothetical protein
MSEEDAHAGELTEGADESDGREAETGHLDGVEAGAGCTEIWEHLSEQREQAGSD